MSSVAITKHQLDREADGETTLELVGVRYTGNKTMFPVSSHLEGQGWPRAAPMSGGATAGDNGPWYFALMPDEGLGYLENRNDLEVVYGDQRERFAELLLEQRRLPNNVFGRGANRNLQDRVFDTLGLKPEMKAGPIRDQLRELAGIEADEDDDPEDDTDKSLVESLVDSYSRSELGEAAKALRKDADDFDLRQNSKKVERAEFIAGFESDDRAAALPSNEGGDD